jgi:hypothetical protein
LNSDDYYAPHALKQMAEAFQERGEEVEVIVGTGHKINEAGEVVYTPEATDLRFDAFLDWKANNFLQPACFFRRRAWELAGPLREDLFYCLDVDLWLRMAREVSFDRITPTIAYAYEHPEAKTRAHVRRMRAETALVVAEHGGLEVARENLFDMADRLHELEAQAARITQSPLYKLLGPLYRSVRRFLLRD